MSAVTIIRDPFSYLNIIKRDAHEIKRRDIHTKRFA